MPQRLKDIKKSIKIKRKWLKCWGLYKHSVVVALSWGWRGALSCKRSLTTCFGMCEVVWPRGHKTPQWCVSAHSERKDRREEEVEEGGWKYLPLPCKGKRNGGSGGAGVSTKLREKFCMRLVAVFWAARRGNCCELAVRRPERTWEETVAPF